MARSVGRLQPLLRRRRRRGLQPRLDRGILGVGMGQVGDEVLDHVHVRQRGDLHLALEVGDRGGAGEAVAAVHVHRARPADPLAARAAEGQRRVDLVLDLDQRVEDHRPGLVEVDGVGVEARIGAAVGVVAIDFERLEPLAVFGLVRAPLGDAAVLRQSKLGQARSSLLGRAASTRRRSKKRPPGERTALRDLRRALALAGR